MSFWKILIEVGLLNVINLIYRLNLSILAYFCPCQSFFISCLALIFHHSARLHHIVFQYPQQSHYRIYDCLHQIMRFLTHDSQSHHFCTLYQAIF